jgi:hypothetical protein
MTIVTMMERKECVEIDPAQIFQQFNLQADRDLHDLILDVVEDVARNLGREETEYLKQITTIFATVWIVSLHWPKNLGLDIYRVLRRM